VSFRHLGQHTSGLAEPIANQAFQDAIVADPARRLTALETLAAALQQPRRHAPGERYSYSNANSVLLAKAIEGIRKQMLQAMMRDPPMSLAGNESPFVYPASDQWRASGLRAFRHAREGRPIGYGTLLTDVTMFSPSWASAGGDWSARISDLLAFGRFLLASALLNPSWFAQLSGTHAASRNGDRGYGFHCMRHGDWFGHTGDVPGFSAALWIRPQRGDCMAALSNLSNTRAGKNPADELLWLL
jgi:D-alanyl-D-alanine carboxypeptidase